MIYIFVSMLVIMIHSLIPYIYGLHENSGTPYSQYYCEDNLETYRNIKNNHYYSSLLYLKGQLPYLNPLNFMHWDIPNTIFIESNSA